jgi:hypothetical protein
MFGKGFIKIVAVLKIFFLHSDVPQIEACLYHVEEYFPEFITRMNVPGVQLRLGISAELFQS